MPMSDTLIQPAAAVSPHGSLIKRSLYQEYLEEGGKTGYSEMFQIEDRAAKLEKEISERILLMVFRLPEYT